LKGTKGNNKKLKIILENWRKMKEEQASSQDSSPHFNLVKAGLISTISMNITNPNSLR
jgi:hypothetical protein